MTTCDDMKGITTDNSYFLHFREDDDILYVDKTMYAYRLIRERGNFFFLSRPRRFGKSLFCSMLHFLFEGKKEFFKGLYIAEKTDYGFDSYPVIHLNFGNIPIAEPDLFIRSLTEELRFIAEDYGLKTRTDNPAVILREMLAEIYRDTGKQSVIIIDEYDRPLTGKMDAEEHEIRKIRDTLNDFFSAIKNSSEFIRFLFITGVVSEYSISRAPENRT